ncbi:MAG: AMP-binding protein [Thermodesulfobacteriota bacterium]
MFLQDHHKTALTWKGQKVSYADFLDRVHRYAACLPENCHRVLILSENRPEWLYACYAAWKNGSTVIPVDYLSTVEELRYIVEDSSPEVLLCSRERKEVVDEVASSVGYEVQVLVIEDLPLEGDPVETSGLADPQVDATALIIYTSGTTGDPKGVMLSFENILANIEAVSVGVPIYNIEERVLLLLPLHHIFPLLGSMAAPLYVGATVAMSPSLSSEDILATMQENRVTIIIGVPRLYRMISQGIVDKINAKAVARFLFSLAEKVQSRFLSKLIFSTVHKKFGGSLKFLVSGGAALDPEVGQTFTTLGFEILEGYGMTESAPMITFTRPGRVTIGSAGTAMNCTTIEIRDDEIVASGKNIMQGYLNRPEETAEVLKDGWLYTGDLGRLDEQGRLFVTGRKKEIIVLASGKNLNPVLIEQKLEGLSDCISEVGVFVKDDILQAVIRPDFIKARLQSVHDLDDHFRYNVIESYNKTVSPYKRLHHLTLVDEELPRTRLSKLRRFQLPEMVGQKSHHKKSGEQPDFEEYRIIKGYLENQTSREIFADDHLEIDIGLDSLEQVSLLVFLKSSFGVEISEEKLMNHQTVRKLSEFIKEKKKKITVELINWNEILREKVDLTLPVSWVTINIFQNISRIFFNLYFRFRGAGRENLPDSPCIIAPNHQSYYDGMFVASVLKGRTLKKTYFYAKKKHVKSRVLGFLADHNNVIVVDINSGLRESIQKLAEVLRRGKNIMIFPEGTRSLDGSLGEFRKLFAILAKELDVPIVPVAINGAYHALPPGSFIPKPLSPVTVSFQEPIYPREHSYDSLTEEVHRRVSTALR